MKKLLLGVLGIATLSSCSKEQYEPSPTYLVSQHDTTQGYTTYYVVNARERVGETLTATYQGEEYTGNQMPLENGDNFIFPISYPNLAVTLTDNIPRDEVIFNLGGLEL